MKDVAERKGNIEMIDRKLIVEARINERLAEAANERLARGIAKERQGLFGRWRYGRMPRKGRPVPAIP